MPDVGDLVNLSNFGRLYFTDSRWDVPIRVMSISSNEERGVYGQWQLDIPNRPEVFLYLSEIEPIKK